LGLDDRRFRQKVKLVALFVKQWRHIIYHGLCMPFVIMHKQRSKTSFTKK